MIWTLSANPALDITYTLETFTVGEVHRVHDVRVLPGGKGVNVSRVLGQLGVATTLTGFIGGSSGIEFRSLLAQLSLPPKTLTEKWVQTCVPTRRSVAVVNQGEATVLNEAGQVVPNHSWDELLELLGSVAGPKSGDVVVISGSMPPQTPPTMVAQLISVCRQKGAQTIVDTSGPSLICAAKAGADLLKPNHLELLEATKTQSIHAGAHALLRAGARTVVVSSAQAGMEVFTAANLKGWRCVPARIIAGNPTGAGDAAVAAWARALATLGDESRVEDVIPAALKDAVALSAAAVACPVAGEFCPTIYEEFLSKSTVKENHAVI